ncbi:SDR family oxidoreductase [Svornostia abyssi]|uniref:SDR family oxidoreductase n=1 Tax=Svornostia abyssi TaxID=2898438 RepID=A0ABY5PHT7_9ACTN|nr:SDR family oxidoreductase [Parviterribacteraceae bacterium J379]
MSDGRPVALVTGANRGIGHEVCRQLAARGFTVLLGARDPRKGSDAAAALGSHVHPLVLDVADHGSVAAAARRVEDEFGRCDALVNNAAINYDWDAFAHSADLGIIQESLDTNLLGAWDVTLAFLPLLRRSPHGRIVNVSSQAGSLATMGGGTPAYHVSKAALNAFTLTLADELHGEGVLVNAVCPGWTYSGEGGMGAPGGRPVDEGAASIVWAVVLPDGGPTGGFYRDGRPIPW